MSSYEEDSPHATYASTFAKASWAAQPHIAARIQIVAKARYRALHVADNALFVPTDDLDSEGTD